MTFQRGIEIQVSLYLIYESTLFTFAFPLLVDTLQISDQSPAEVNYCPPQASNAKWVQKLHPTGFYQVFFFTSHSKCTEIMQQIAQNINNIFLLIDFFNFYKSVFYYVLMMPFHTHPLLLLLLSDNKKAKYNKNLGDVFQGPLKTWMIHIYLGLLQIHVMCGCDNTLCIH